MPGYESDQRAMHERARRIAELRADGHSDRTIAKILGICHDAVSTYSRRHQLPAAASRADLVALAKVGGSRPWSAKAGLS